MRTADQDPTISVVISTHNRGALLEGALRDLLAQRGAPAYEVVVVDNNSTDDTRALVTRLMAESAGRLRYVFEPRQGVAYGRNAGVAAARAPIIAFTDDDVRARPDWLAVIHRAFVEHPWAAFVGGRVLPRWPGPVPRWLTPDLWSPLALVDYGDAPVRVDLDRPICVVTANAAFRRTAFERAGGFDPRFQHVPGAVSACEDHELELRILRDGGAGLYHPDMVIEADVQPERLQKRYYRRWYLDHGRAIARLLGPGEMFDSRMFPTPRPPGTRTVLGASPWVYRHLATDAVRATLAWLRGRRDEAFRYECAVRETIGHALTVAPRGPQAWTPPHAALDLGSRLT